jgi:hypothetical protein
MGLNRNLGQLTEVITESGGNILIGTGTSSGQKLRVNGAGRFDGNVGIGIVPNYSLDVYSAISPATIGLKSNDLYNSVFRDYTTVTSSFLDIVTERTDGGSFNFLLVITSTLIASAGFRSYYTLSVTGRGTSGNTTILSYTPILTPTRTAIVVSFPSNGVIRLTLSGGESCQIKATIMGHGAL